MTVVTTARDWAVTSGVVAFAATPRLRTRPHAAYRALRRVDPVHPSPIGIWVLSGHREVSAAFRHASLGSDERRADMGAIRLGPFRRFLGETTGAEVDGSDAAGPFSAVFRQLMLFRDPPDHTRLRSLVNKAFTPRAMEVLEGRIAEIVDRQLAGVERRGSMDFLAEVAYPIPALVICELMGVPLADHTIIARHAPAIATRLDPSPMRSAAVHAAADAAADELIAYLNGVIAARRANPGSDIISALLAAEDAGDRLTHDELVATVILLLIAGHETTANLLGNGLLALLRHRDQWERFRSDPTVDRDAVEELLRFDGPIQMAERISLAEAQVGRACIPAGRIIVLCVAAANRDPAAFDRPDVLDLGRHPNPHVGFGGGAHFCVGAPLARLETRVTLRAVADRLPDLRVASSRLRWRPSFTIRGLDALPLTWSTRR